MKTIDLSDKLKTHVIANEFAKVIHKIIRIEADPSIFYTLEPEAIIAIAHNLITRLLSDLSESWLMKREFSAALIALLIENTVLEKLAHLENHKEKMN